MQQTTRSISLTARVVAVCISAVVCGIGLVTFFTHSAPSRSTRFGTTAPLEGQDANLFGICMFLIGLFPLMLLMRSPRKAAWFGSLIGVALLVSIFAATR